MENNIAVIGKRVWSIIRVALFMLRKGISKGKLMMDLNIVLKRLRRGKVISHQQGAREYEFSCSNTPNYFFFPKRHRHNHFFTCTHVPPTQDDDDAVKAVLEMLNSEGMVEASPALPGFGKSPMAMVRQLRVTDSPFPLREAEEEGNQNLVDKAAEDFIKRFYNQLRKQP